jgi:hypothetical protein
VWELVVADLTGAEKGRLGGAVSDREVTPRPLKGVGAGKATVRYDHPMMPWLALGDRCLIKAFEDGKLRMIGPVVGFEKDRDQAGGSTAVVFASGGWRLGLRLIGKYLAGFQDGTALAPIDKAQVMGHVLDEVNAERATGIVKGTLAPTSKGAYGPWWYKPALDAWQEIGAPIDGPDWEIEPLEPTTNNGAIGQLNAAPTLGADKTNALWQFGTGKKNVKSWRHVINPGVLANRAIHLAPGYPDNIAAGVTPEVRYDDGPSQARGLYETVVQGDLQVDNLRQQLVGAHVQLRKQPSQVITFEPRMEIAGDIRYRPTDDAQGYKEGDLIRFHAQERYPVLDASGNRVGTQVIDTVDAIFRVYAITFGLDQEGNPTPAFTIVQEG